jgi:hypothetical protein
MGYIYLSDRFTVKLPVCMQRQFRVHVFFAMYPTNRNGNVYMCFLIVLLMLLCICISPVRTSQEAHSVSVK